MWLDTAEHPELLNRLADLFSRVHIGRKSVDTLTVNPQDAHVLDSVIWGAEVKTDEKVRKGFVTVNENGGQRPLY